MGGCASKPKGLNAESDLVSEQVTAAAAPAADAPEVKDEEETTKETEAPKQEAEEYEPKFDTAESEPLALENSGESLEATAGETPSEEEQKGEEETKEEEEAEPEEEATDDTRQEA